MTISAEAQSLIGKKVLVPRADINFEILRIRDVKSINYDHYNEIHEVFYMETIQPDVVPLEGFWTREQFWTLEELKPMLE
mgnify:CR=1 FL=1